MPSPESSGGTLCELSRLLAFDCAGIERLSNLALLCCLTGNVLASSTAGRCMDDILAVIL